MSAIELILKGAVDVTSHFLKSASDKFHEDPTSFFTKDVTETENFAELQSELLKNRIRIGGPINQDQILEFIQRHLEYVERWCSTVYMKDMVKKRQLSDVYVGLDIYLIPRQRHVADKEKTALRASSEILTDLSSSVLILGLPGAGKTTTIKDFLHKFSTENDPKFSKFSFPLLVRLRDLDTGGNTFWHLFTHLASIIGYAPDFSIPQEIRDTYLDIDAVVWGWQRHAYGRIRR